MQTFATIVTALGVLLAALALRASQRQRLRQFEAVYVQRYWTLMDELSLAGMRGDPGSHEDPENEKVVRAYVLLCEDQCEMRSAGWIGDATWRIWREGMTENLGDSAGKPGREPFASVWKHLAADPSKFTLLQALVDDNFEDYEPPLSRRLVNGLSGRGGV